MTLSEDEMDNFINPMNRRRKKFTKEQQMLGMWADDSDDDEEAGPSGRYQNRPKNYTAPVNFVAGGIQQSGKQFEKKKKDEDDVDDEDKDDEENLDVPISSSDSEDDDGRESRPSFSMNLSSDIAGLRKKRMAVNPSLMKSGVGGWEVYTKGIGAKLLLQMGFEPGKGLGKKLQGISAPVEAHLRKGRGAIGAYGPEKATKVITVEKKDEDIEAEKDFKKKLSHWRKNEISGNKRKVKYHYKSVDQILEDDKLRPNNLKVPLSNDISRVKVIDMTGPEQRVLSGYHAIAGGQKRPDESINESDRKSTINFSLPELEHNLKLIVDMCEQDIIQNDRRTRHLSDRSIALEAEKRNIEKLSRNNEIQLETLENVLTIVEKLMAKTDECTLKQTADAFRDLQDKYYEEYRMYELSELAISLVGPKIKNHLVSWNPLIDPKQPISIMKEWKDILEYRKTTLQSRNMNPYDQLVWDAWMPSIRGAVQLWECRQPEPLIELIESWMPLLPLWILDNILDLLILPKLTLAVEEWNPVTDTVPIHTWIHPWLPLCGSRMDTLIYPIIRRKLGSALGRWHPSDRSARLILEPWVGVFSKGDMEAFLVKNILPKLQVILSEFVINPHQQQFYLHQWQWVYEWETLLPVHIMVGLLDSFFFPRWLQVLTLWLNHSPNYDQIAEWYSGWKKMFSDKILAEPIIKEHFKKALEIMNRAATAQGSIEQMSYLTSLDRIQTSVPQIPPQISQPRIEKLAEAVRSASQIPQGFKDLVQKKCEERGILFMPIANRYREAKQVYKVGNLQAYIDGNVLFVCQNNINWIPTHLNALLEMADL